MKVKVQENRSVSKEVDLEYPIYLYFQDELCHDEYVMVHEKGAVIVKENVFGTTIERTGVYYIQDYQIPAALTKKEYFDEALNDALKSIENIVR